MLADDRQGRGRRSGQGFHCATVEPLLDNKEAFGDPLRQPGPSLTLCPYPSPQSQGPQHQGPQELK
jgi:hypothetical protein